MIYSKNAMTVLEKRYLVKDANQNPIEDVSGLFRRVSSAIAAGDLNFDSSANLEALAEDFYEMMTNLDFLPNSPTLMNAGRPLGQLSACFVLPVGDSMEEIFEAIKQAALIHKSGGGTGFSFSRLRGTGSVVQSTGGVASGPISFMKVFNMATEAVKQGGTRRGANMGVLRVDHPDILEFIDCKQDNNDINNFNISVGVTEAFMEAVENRSSYDIIDPRTHCVIRQLDASDVFNRIVEHAWKNGEPGILFLDRLNRDNIVPNQGEFESTNPCGEQPLLPYESCNLGSINLSNMVITTQDGPAVDYSHLQKTIRKAVHFLDNVIEVNRYPLPQIDTATRQTRKIGLGVMGWADLLLLIGIPYNSSKAVELAGEIMEFINRTGHTESVHLAQSRGAFPLYEESTWNISKDALPLRNGTITTIAPTGTISMIANCSSGVEPIFAYAYIRNVMDNTQMLEVNPILKQTLQNNGLYSEELMQKIVAEGTLAHIPEIPQNLKEVFVCAHDISPEAHVRMQAAFQKYTDNAVSKTVNFPNNATQEAVSQVYTLAYKLGCKGVTIYRDGSRQMQVLNIGKVNSGETPDPEFKDNRIINKITPRPRPAITRGITERMKIGCGNLYVTVNYDDLGICEVFTSTGKVGGCPSQSEATARLASVALRAGMDVQEIIHQLQGIRCPSTVRQANVTCTSCPDAIARVLQKVVSMLKNTQGSPFYLEEPEEPEKSKENSTSSPSLETTSYKKVLLNLTLNSNQESICPECSAKLEHEGGCVSCRSCGFSKCS